MNTDKSPFWMLLLALPITWSGVEKFMNGATHVLGFLTAVTGLVIGIYGALWWRRKYLGRERESDRYRFGSRSVRSVRRGRWWRFWFFILAWILPILPALAQDTLVTPPVAPPEVSAYSMFLAMFKQVLNQPASVLVIVGLSVVAYLLEIWPNFNSRFIPIVCILAGPAVYPAFMNTHSVPKEFPYPIAVLIVNGLVAGLASSVAHKFIITAAMKRFGGGDETKP